MIIVEGRSPTAGLSAHRERASELLPADDLWGKTVWDTEGDAQEASPGSAAAGIEHRSRREKSGSFRGHRQRPAPRRRTLGCRRGDGIEESQGDCRSRYARGRQHRRSQGFHGGRDRRQEGAGRERGHRPGPADLRHAGADERDQRNGRFADAQPPRCAVRRGAQDFGRSDARKARHRWQARIWSPIRPALAAPSPAAGFRASTKPLLRGNQAAVLGGQRRSRIRSRLGAGQCQRRRRSRGAAVRQPAVQRRRHGPDFLRRDRRRGHGAVRTGHPEQGRDRPRGAFRFRRSAVQTWPK
jgi:hypothetical protein